MLVFLMLGILQLALAAATGAQASVPPLPFVCHIESGKPAGDALNRASVCERFQKALELRLKANVRPTPSTPRSGDWIRVDIRFSHGDTATATLSQRRRGKRLSHGAQSISVSDRKINLLSVEQLARVVAAQVKLR